MKRYVRNGFLIVTLSLFFSGCAYYAILSEQAPSPSLKKYQNIYVGWMDLGEDRWKWYGYETPEPWVATIKSANESSLPQYFKEILPRKNITTAMTKKDNPANAQLYIKFNKAVYFQKTSTGAKIASDALSGGQVRKGEDTLDLDISFVDVPTSTEIYRVVVSIYSSGSEYSGYYFEGRVNNCIYNTAYYIKEKLEK